MTLNLALRNLWRNRRRTLITAASVMFAAFFAIAMSSLQKGTWLNTLEGMLHNYTGYIQIHSNGYWENQSIDRLIDNDPSLMNSIREISDVDLVMERLENFALVSTGPKTKGVLIAGVNSGQVETFSGISSQIREGQWIRSGKNEAVVGKDLAELLDQTLGDTLIAISQGYRGNNAVGQYTITGIADFGNPEFNKQMIYIPLDKAQEFFAAPGMVSTIALTTHNIDEVEATKQQLENALDSTQYEIMTYHELLPSILEAQALDEAGAKIILYILYILIGFGMLGTVMMMLKERQYEFGVLKAIGMKSGQLFQMVFIEVLSIGIIGVLAGMLLSFPLITYFNHYPIHLGAGYAEAYEQFNMEPLMKSVVRSDVFFEQALIVFIMIALISVYPFFSLKKLRPVEAMRS